MLELTNAQIGGWLGQFLLPLFRIASMLMVMPVIGKLSTARAASTA